MRFLLMVLLTGAGLLLFGAPAAHAQEDTGAVAGVVVDGSTGETLPGANVLVAGTQEGTSTDIDGRYRLEGLAPGTYDLEFSFVSFQTKTVTGVEVEAGQTATLDVTLGATAQELEEVVVTAEVARNSEAGLLRRRQRAAAVSDAISAEAISESGSSNAGDAMEKVTGASVEDGKYVNVRGLGGRYVNTTLNGAELPSADPEENAVPFDLFPSNLLENIVTSKTFTPDRSGNFTGGSIDIGTVAFPSDFSLTVNTSAGYNTQARFGQSRTGFIPGLSEVPALAEGEIPSRASANNDPDAAQRLDAITRSFSGGIAPGRSSVPLEQSYEAAFGNELELLGRPLGVVASLAYDQNVNGYTGGTTGRYPLLSPGNATLTSELNLDDEATVVEDLYSGLLNLSMRPADGHEVGLNVLYTQSDEQEGRFQEGFAQDLAGSVLQTRVLRRTERWVGSLQARGEHAFGAGLLEGLYGAPVGGVEVSWNGSYSRTRQEEPDYRVFANDFYPDRSEGQQYGINVSQYQAPTRYFRSLEEDGWSGKGAVGVPVFDVADVKVGGSYARRDRAFGQRRFFYEMGSTSYDGDPGTFFGETIGLVDLDGDGDDELGNIIGERTRRDDNYDGLQTIAAGFAMVDLQVGTLLERLGASRVPVLSDLRVIGGARVEHTDQQVQVTGDRNEILETDILPSVNAVYAVGEDTNVRVAYGRTLARPSFREFSPTTFQEFIAAYPLRGADLDRTLVDNFDARWEWFPNAGEILAVSAFYKDFDQPIVRIFDPLAANPVITFTNGVCIGGSDDGCAGGRVVPTEATVYGMEFEARKQLGFLAGAFENFGVGANLTLARSRADIPFDQNGEVRIEERRFQGQSDYLVNANLAYENREAGTTASLYYNVFGERLNTIVRDSGPPRFEQPRHTLDVTLAQRFVPLGLRALKVRLRARNLLGAQYEVTRTYGGESNSVRAYELGRTFTLGLEYTL